MRPRTRSMSRAAAQNSAQWSTKHSKESITKKPTGVVQLITKPRNSITLTDMRKALSMLLKLKANPARLRHYNPAELIVISTDDEDDDDDVVEVPMKKPNIQIIPGRSSINLSSIQNITRPSTSTYRPSTPIAPDTPSPPPPSPPLPSPPPPSPPIPSTPPPSPPSPTGSRPPSPAAASRSRPRLRSILPAAPRSRSRSMSSEASGSSLRSRSISPEAPRSRSRSISPEASRSRSISPEASRSSSRSRSSSPVASGSRPRLVIPVGWGYSSRSSSRGSSRSRSPSPALSEVSSISDYSTDTIPERRWTVYDPNEIRQNDPNDLLPKDDLSVEDYFRQEEYLYRILGKTRVRRSEIRNYFFTTPLEKDSPLHQIQGTTVRLSRPILTNVVLENYGVFAMCYPTKMYKRYRYSTIKRYHFYSCQLAEHGYPLNDEFKHVGCMKARLPPFSVILPIPPPGVRLYYIVRGSDEYNRCGPTCAPTTWAAL